MQRTEFFETAVKHGFYGNEKSYLEGKRDNVRRFWEDISVKLMLRPAVKKLLELHECLRVVDLGCGSGEGIEVLCHIPSGGTSEDFLLDLQHVEDYHGVDLSPAMIAQGSVNYTDNDNIHFSLADLSKGFPLGEECGYHLYLSTYAALSHLSSAELEVLLSDIFKHAKDTRMSWWICMGAGLRNGRGIGVEMPRILCPIRWRIFTMRLARGKNQRNGSMPLTGRHPN